MTTARDILREALQWKPCIGCVGPCLVPNWKEGDPISDKNCWVDKTKALLASPPTHAELYADDPRAAHAAWEASGTRKAFSDWLLSKAEEGAIR